MKQLALLITFALAIGIVLPLRVGTEEIEQSKAKTALLSSYSEIEVTQTVSLAKNLAAYARKTRSPEALAVAAEILMTVQTKEVRLEKQEEKGDELSAKEVAKADTSRMVLDPTALLIEAKGMAKGNEAAMAVIENLQKRTAKKTRGGWPRMAWHIDRVMPGTIDIYSMMFKGNELAIIRVSGDGDTDLDLYVYDLNGKLVAQDDDATDECFVMWFPIKRQTFKIMIKNRGIVYNEYLLTTN